MKINETNISQIHKEIIEIEKKIEEIKNDIFLNEKSNMSLREYMTDKALRDKLYDLQAIKWGLEKKKKLIINKGLEAER